MRIIVSGISPSYHARPGSIDNWMAYVVGLRRLGHEVYVMDDVDAARCFDAEGREVSFDRWEGRLQYERIARDYGVWPRCCLLFGGGRQTHGLSFAEAASVAERSDLLLVVGGRLSTPEIAEAVGCRAYVDQNPGKTQVYQSEYGVEYDFPRYDFCFTRGLNIGTPNCPIPTCGVEWHGILPPVHLPDWPVSSNEHAERFTSVSTWSGRHSYYLNGVFSGQKGDGWLSVAELPRRVGHTLEVALSVDPGYEDDIETLRRNEWIVSDARRFTDLSSYREFIAGSLGEFSVAHRPYAQFRIGWFSERSARYLASGRPVIVQSTGIEAHVPTGKGILTFSSLDQAVERFEAVQRDYAAHAAAARSFAEQYLDSNRVLGSILETMGLESRARTASANKP